MGGGRRNAAGDRVGGVLYCRGESCVYYHECCVYRKVRACFFFFLGGRRLFCSVTTRVRPLAVKNTWRLGVPEQRKCRKKSYNNNITIIYKNRFVYNFKGYLFRFQGFANGKTQPVPPTAVALVQSPGCRRRRGFDDRQRQRSVGFLFRPPPRPGPCSFGG